MRAKNEDSLPSSYSRKNCTRPNPSPNALQIFTSQNVVGLSARDRCLIGAVKSLFPYLVAHGMESLSLADGIQGVLIPGRAWALPFARTT